jgi:ATP-dependent DNA helicase RecG
MTPDELEKLIRQGEGYNLEFKQSLPSKASELAEEICAFANAAGGTLLVGVDDKGNIVGTVLDNPGKSRLQNILNTIEPRVEVAITAIIYDNKTVLCLECQSGKEKPYAVSGSIIVRNGPNSEKITSVQRMRDFFQHSDRIFFDEKICTPFNTEHDLDKLFFGKFLVKAGISNLLPFSNLLRSLMLVDGNGNFKNATVLFFGNNVQQFYEQALIRCVLFKGTDKYKILDDKTYTGNLVQQYEQAYTYIVSKLNLSYIIKGGGPRKEVLEIPETVFKEALINALCHRDYYEKGAVIIVEIFDDRVEISNPGGLVHSITKEEFGTRSLSRNPLIFGLFQRMQLVEKIGSGIRRMRTEMKNAGLPEPVFNLDGIFTAKFYRPIVFDKWISTWSMHINTPLVKMLQEMHDNPGITKPELSDIIGQGKTTIDKHIAHLKLLGILSRSGSNKTGRWRINLIRSPDKLY